MTHDDDRLPAESRILPARRRPRAQPSWRRCASELYVLEPQFCSVTYGAGGSTQDGTLPTVQAILDEGQRGRPRTSPASARRASRCASGWRSSRRMGLRRIVALRGDLPSGYGAMRRVPLCQRPGGLHPRRDRRPLPHRGGRLPRDAPAGASRRRPTCRPSPPRSRPAPARRSRSSSSTATPTSASSTRRTSSAPTSRWCRASCRSPIRRHAALRRQLRRRDPALDPPAPAGLWRRQRVDQAFGLDVVTDLCDQLRNAGVPALHFYTMNQSAPVLEICRRLDLGLAAAAPRLMFQRDTGAPHI